ncbi:hypothetical protein JOC94_002089 [Bacillus thermophilus]|uniref:Uncharacterized protein n=1 Tax=Siminovitchia thermophila TaxID=1245522 RepID=A0ABS2R635_9BACI|nr:hypothetical protein [Siminovitchia thermophila]
MLVEPIGHLGAVFSHLALLYSLNTAPYMREKLSQYIIRKLLA